MAWSSVQTAQNKTGTGTSVAQAFGATVTSGNIVNGYIFYTTSTTNVITSITDDKSNSYTIVDFINSGGVSVATFWSNGLITNTPQTITVNVSVSQTAVLWLGIDEIKPPSAGTVALDGHNTGAGNSTTPATSAFTTILNGDLIYAAVVDNGATVAGSGFTLNQAGSNFNSEIQTQSAAGSIQGTFTASTGAWVAAAFAISLAPTGIVLGAARLT